MDAVATRIQELINSLGISNKDFAEKIDISPAIISHVLSGRNKASLHLISQITNVYTNVNLAYLLHGTGGLFNANKNQPISPTQSNEPPLPSGARYVAVPQGAPVYKSLQEEEPEEDSIRKLDEIETPESKSTNVYTNVNREESKSIERIVIFYTDKSFEEYRP